MFVNNLLKMILMMLIASGICEAQFLDSFDNDEIEGWFFFTGDGAATIDFVQKDGFARILVDATKDKYNVYWTLIKRDVTAFLDLDKLKDSAFELRVEAKVRVSHAPRRVNFMVNTQRTTNYHEHLMEFDIPDTTGWHTISMTTKNFDAVPGDTVYVQLCATDWGLGKYHVDLDYYRADVVNVNLTGPDKGELVPYHPPVPEVSTFANHLTVTHDSLINSDFPKVNFNDWHVKEKEGDAHILTVNANQWAILRWDLEPYQNAQLDGPGLLELTTQSVPQGGDYIAAFGQDLGMEFDKIRVIEIIGGNSQWDQDKVTYDNFMQGHTYADVFNTQMIFDAELSEEPGSKNFITISKPVLQRLLNGTTKGLLIRPLGALNASVYASENQKGNGPKLHFNTSEVLQTSGTQESEARSQKR
jgi:hypothetical protein